MDDRIIGVCHKVQTQNSSQNSDDCQNSSKFGVVFHFQVLLSFFNLSAYNWPGERNCEAADRQQDHSQGGIDQQQLYPSNSHTAARLG
jgi:hypothetical protein